MIISETEVVSSKEVYVRVIYTKEEALKLNKVLNCLTDLSSWILFDVKAKENSYEIFDISMFSQIDDSNMRLPKLIFTNASIKMVVEAAKKALKIVEEEKPLNVSEKFFEIEGDYSNQDSFPSEYTAKNSELYGTTKWD